MKKLVFLLVLKNLTLISVNSEPKFDYTPNVIRGNVSTEVVLTPIYDEYHTEEFQITASDGSVLEFDCFDIGYDGTPDSIRFLQPNNSARLYGKIMNEQPTRVQGSIYANGHIILINPHGFIFELDGTLGESINVAKLHVISGTADEDFDEYTLSGYISGGWDGSIISDETILAGPVNDVSPGFFSEGATSIIEGETFQDATLKLVNSDNSLTVPIDSEITVEGLGAVSDLAGQAVLQTGVMLASQTQFQPTTVASTASTSSSTSDGGNEESTEESTSDSSDDSGNKANANIVNSTVAGVAPFSPISEPILSVEASKILESALSPEVEQKMSKFLTP